jgi:hypothetical protein
MPLRYQRLAIATARSPSWLSVASLKPRPQVTARGAAAKFVAPPVANPIAPPAGGF